MYVCYGHVYSYIRTPVILMLLCISQLQVVGIIRDSRGVQHVMT